MVQTSYKPINRDSSKPVETPESYSIAHSNSPQDNIDLTAFDREFRRAFDKLPSRWEEAALRSDRPPSMQTLFCRKLYRNLTL